MSGCTYKSACIRFDMLIPSNPSDISDIFRSNIASAKPTPSLGVWNPCMGEVEA